MRNKIILTIILGMLLISLVSATTTVTLNSPPNYLNNSLNIVNFICSGSTDSGYLENVSLWTNSTGTWHRNETVNELTYLSNDTFTTTQSLSYVLVKNTTIPGNGIVLNYTNEVWEFAGESSMYLTYTYANGTSVNTSVQMVYGSTPTQYIWTSPFLYNLVAYIEVWMKTKYAGFVRISEGLDNITYKPISDTKTFIYNLTGYTLWNCEYCSNNSDCSFAASNYSINYDTTLNSVSYNLTTYETSSENYVLNITSAYTPTNAKLIYNGTEYPATITTSGTTHLISTNLQIPSSSIGSNYFYFKWNVSSTVTEYSINYTQTVSPMLFGICNATLTVPYWNISFKDESTLSSINGTLQGSTFVYYLGNGTINKTLSYSVTTNSSSYRFCSLPADKPYYVLPDVHYSLTGYPTRIYNPSLLTLTNSTTNTTLYLLSSADGIYVTFITASTSNTPISGVDIEITRVLGGSTATIFSGLTDSAGSVTVWLNPNYDYTITASKTGYTTNTQTIKPTQSQYTLTMETGLDDYEYVPDRKGLKWFAFPSSGVIKTTNYTLFGYNVSAKNDNLVSCKLELLNSNKTIIITSAEVFATNSTLCSVSINYSMNYSKVKGRLLVDLGDGYKILEDDAYWSLVEYNTTGSTLLDWFRGLDELEVSYFNDDEQHREYTYILLFFLVVMIICASLNRMGWDIQTNGGMIFLVGILIWIASIPGFLTLSDISPFAIIDKFFVAILYSMFMVGFAMRELT